MAVSKAHFESVAALFRGVFGTTSDRGSIARIAAGLAGIYLAENPRI